MLKRVGWCFFGVVVGEGGGRNVLVLSIVFVNFIGSGGVSGGGGVNEDLIWYGCYWLICFGVCRVGLIFFLLLFFLGFFLIWKDVNKFFVDYDFFFFLILSLKDELGIDWWFLWFLVYFRV